MGRYLRTVKLGDGMSVPAGDIGAEVTSGVVPQLHYCVDGDDDAIHQGDIGFCSVSPSIEGIVASAQLFTGADSYARACEFVTGQRQVYQRVLDECLKSCIWVYTCPCHGHSNCPFGGSDA
jgi:hypothetical protein